MVNSMLSLIEPLPPRTKVAPALARVCAAFAEAGWSAVPIRTRDMLMFTRGDAVAAVLAEEIASGTRLTAIQRPKGL